MNRVRISTWLFFLCLLLVSCSTSGVAPTQTNTVVPPSPMNKPNTSNEMTASSSAVNGSYSSQIIAATAPYALGNAHEYYIVEQDGRKGVVDDQGRVVLPIQYARVAEVFQTGDDAAFFAALEVAEPYGAITNDKQLGQIYRANGEKLSEGTFAGADRLMDGLFVVSVLDGEHGSRRGVMSQSGEMVAPCQYLDICVYSGGFIGAKGNYQDIHREVDVYDKNGKLLHSGRINFKGVREDFIEATNDTGKLWGLMDLNFQWVVSPVWKDVWPHGDGRFIVSEVEYQGVIDAKGNEIIPVKYHSIVAQINQKNSNNQLYVAVSANKKYNYLLDADGKQMLRSENYIYLDIEDSILITQSKKITAGNSRMQALDLHGNVILSAKGVYWISKMNIFLCEENEQDRYFCSKDGKRLPLPKSNNISYVAKDRFALFKNDPEDRNVSGLYDANGKVIIAFMLQMMKQLDEKTLIFGIGECRDSVKYGLMDLDGNIILPAMYEVLSENPGKQLLCAQTGLTHGLIDRKGNWVWSVPGKITPTDSLFVE